MSQTIVKNAAKKLTVSTQGTLDGVKTVSNLYHLKEVRQLQESLLDHKYDLLRRRWQLLNRRIAADPAVIDAAVWWIDQEVMEINKTLLG